MTSVRDVIKAGQNQVFARHGYPTEYPAGVESMKADVRAAVCVGSRSVAQLSTELYYLLGLVPVAFGNAPSGLRPQLLVKVNRMATKESRESAKATLGAVCHQKLLAELCAMDLLSVEERALATDAEGDAETLAPLLESVLIRAHTKRIRNRLLRQVLQTTPKWLGEELAEWQHPWATELLECGAGAEERLSQLLRDGFVVLDLAADRWQAAEAATEAAKLHMDGRLAQSMDMCNRGAKAIFLQFGNEEECKVLEATVPALWHMARRACGLPFALFEASRRSGGCKDAEELFAGMRLQPTCMLSAYEPGVVYRPHLDSYGGDDNHRALTIMIYLNDAQFTEACGGALRMYRELAEGGSTAALQRRPEGAAVDVAPLTGHVVIFLSRRVWHEVLASTRDRYAMTLWVPACGAAATDG